MDPAAGQPFVPGHRLRGILKQVCSLEDFAPWGVATGEISCNSAASLHDAAAFCRSWLEVLLDHEPNWIRFPLIELLTPFLISKDWKVEEFLSRSKYHTAWPMAKYLKNEPPKASHVDLKPSLTFFARGALLRVLRNRLASFNTRNTHLWWSLLQGVKRGCAPARPCHVEASLIDHGVVLGTSPPDMPPETREKFQWYVDRFLDHVFPKGPEGLKVLDKFGLPVVVPTLGASTEYTAATTTRLGVVSEATQIPQTCWFDSDYCHQVLRDFDRAQKQAAAYEKSCKQRVDPSTVSQPLPTLGTLAQGIALRLGFFSELDSMIERSPGVVEVIRTVFPVYNLRDLMGRPGRDHKDVLIIPLLEPLKIRTISKGNCLNYWSSRSVQKIMWKKVHSLTPCKLIGRPLEVSDLHDLVHRSTSACKHLDIDPFHSWVSGDYKGATDYLNINLTKMVFEGFLKRLEPLEYAEGSRPSEAFCSFATNPQYAWLVERWRNVLYEQNLKYDYEELQTEILQKNGQLMGSPLSFPVLCTLNLICYWWALEEFADKLISPEELPVLVNGDDILFMADGQEGSFYSIWQTCISRAGFRLSIGKNYIHDSVLTVNSECWVWNQSHCEPSFKRIKHLDVGLLINNPSAERLENRVLPLADRLQRVLDGAWSKGRIWHRLKHYYLSEIKAWTQSGKYNVFASLQAGGLGVNRPEEIDVEFTKFQRRLAGYLRHHFDSWTHSDLINFDLLQVESEMTCPHGTNPVTKVHSRRVKWFEGELAKEAVEEDPTLAVVQDIRKGDWVTPAKRLYNSWNHRFTIQTRKGFGKAFRNGIVPLGNCSAPDRVLLYSPVKGVASELSKSHGEPSIQCDIRDYHDTGHDSHVGKPAWLQGCDCEWRVYRPHGKMNHPDRKVIASDEWSVLFEHVSHHDASEKELPRPPSEEEAGRACPQPKSIHGVEATKEHFASSPQVACICSVPGSDSA